jgi:hypothetical protein
VRYSRFTVTRDHSKCEERAPPGVRRGRRKAENRLEASGSGNVDDAVPPPPERAALRRRWANLIRRVYEVDPLVCPRCGAEMRVIGS